MVGVISVAWGSLLAAINHGHVLSSTHTLTELTGVSIMMINTETISYDEVVFIYFLRNKQGFQALSVISDVENKGTRD